MKILHFFKPIQSRFQRIQGYLPRAFQMEFFLEVRYPCSSQLSPTLICKVVIYLDKDEWLGLYPSQHLVNYESAIYKEQTAIQLLI